VGGGDLGALAVLAGEVGRIADLLDATGIAVTGVLTEAALRLLSAGGPETFSAFFRAGALALGVGPPVLSHPLPRVPSAGR
jgi:hypothetical protein